MTPQQAGARRPRLGSWLLTAGLMVAIALPPGELAGWTRSPTDAVIPGLVTGLWIFKVLLGLHLLVASRLASILPTTQAPSGPERGPGGTDVVLLMAVALLLRLPHLNDGLWYDEIQTLVDYVRQPWGLLLTTFDSSNQHLLYSISAKAVFAVAGESAAGLRLPAVLFGGASIWAMQTFGRRWLPAREARWGAVLLTVSYHHVWFSQNARGYTGLLLGTLVGTALFLDLLRGAPCTARRLWGYAGVLALTMLVHVTALVVLAAHGLCWLWYVRRLPAGVGRWGPLAALTLAGSLALMAYAPLLPQAMVALSASGTGPVATEWQRPAWFLAEVGRGLVRGIPGGVVVIPLAGMVTITGVASAWRRDQVATALMLLPLLVMGMLVVGTGHNLWPRFFFFGAAFLVQFAVRGVFATLDRISPAHASRIAGVGLGLVTIGSLALLPRAWSPKQDYPGALHWVEAHAAPGDALAGTAMMELPINDWLGRHWPIVEDVASLRAVESGHTRTWVLYTFPIRLSALSPGLWDYLAAEYRPAHVAPGTVGEGAIVVLARPPLPSTAENSP